MVRFAQRNLPEGRPDERARVVGRQRSDGFARAGIRAVPDAMGGGQKGFEASEGIERGNPGVRAEVARGESGSWVW
jgi:hypothetical protein